MEKGSGDDLAGTIPYTHVHRVIMYNVAFLNMSSRSS